MNSTVTEAAPFYGDYDWSARPDFLVLRNALGWSEDYVIRCENGRPTKKIVDALNNQQWQLAASIGGRWLNQCPIDLRAHYLTAIAHKNLGNQLAEMNHQQWMEGLMESIMASGDGQGPLSAFVTISVSEEYDALYMFGLRSESQTLVNTSPVCDVIRAVDDDGNNMDIYFAPNAHFARLERLLGQNE